MLSGKPGDKTREAATGSIESPNSAIGAFTALLVIFRIRPKPRICHGIDGPAHHIDGGKTYWHLVHRTSLFDSSCESLRGWSARIVHQNVWIRASLKYLVLPISVVYQPPRRQPWYQMRLQFLMAADNCALRAQIVTATPSFAKAIAQPLPSPLLAAETMAFLPDIPRSMTLINCIVIDRKLYVGLLSGTNVQVVHETITVISAGLILHSLRRMFMMLKIGRQRGDVPVIIDNIQ